MNPSTGSVDEAADHRAEPERRGLEEHIARVALPSGGPCRPAARGADARGGRFSGSTFSGFSVSALPCVSSLIQRKLKKTVMKMPIATIAHETTKPTSSTTTPTAKPTGQRLGPGT